MGFHNVAGKEAIANIAPTTVMTSTLITVSQNLSNTIEYGLAKHAVLRLTPAAADTRREAQLKAMAIKFDDALDKLVTSSKPLISFIAGCITGAATIDKAGLHCLAIPVFFIVFVILDTFHPLPAKGAAVKAKAGGEVAPAKGGCGSAGVVTSTHELAAAAAPHEKNEATILPATTTTSAESVV